MSTLDSLHAECEGVSNGLRSLMSAPLSALHSNSIYFGNFLKNYCPYCHKIFTVPRGHRWHQRVKISGKPDEGGGEGEKKFFRPPISPLRGDYDHQILTHVRALKYPYVRHIKSTLALGGTTG